MLDFLYLSLGLVLLVFGGELLLTHAIRFAQIIRISTIWISVVIISFGTSAPELIVSMDAAAQNLPDIAVGNVIGSNIANTLLVLGAAAVIQPIEVQYRELKLENYLLLFVFAMLCVCTYIGELHISFSITCLVAIGTYFWYSYKNSRLPEDPDAQTQTEFKTAIKPLSLAILGLVLLMGGADLLIMGAVGIARFLNVSEAVISLSMVALGTSLPELVTSVFAAIKGRTYITLANVVGSNLFNIMVVLGLTSLFFSVAVSEQFMRFDIWVMGILTIALFMMMLLLRHIGRAMGALLLVIYVAYITYLYIQNGAN